MEGKAMEKLNVLFTAEAEDALLKELYEFCNLEFAGWLLF